MSWEYARIKYERRAAFWLGVRCIVAGFIVSFVVCIIMKG